MQLKVIDSDKVKILIEDKDIDGYCLSFESLDYKDSASREFILTLLNEVYVQTGVSFLDSKVLIEVIPGISGSYYIIITRLSPSSEMTVNFDKTAKADEDMYLFELHNPEGIYDIADVFGRETRLKASATSMYKYRQKYYLTADFSPETVSSTGFKKLLKSIEEYSDKCRWSILNEAVLKEWGELIWSGPLSKIVTGGH